MTLLLAAPRMLLLPARCRPRLLDLFCGAGGAGWGYYLAGFDVTGVDIKPQPHYPLRFVQGDALEYLAAHGHEYDAIHASPPCQAFTALGRLWKSDITYQSRHPDLVADTRRLLERIGRPYVIENVPGSPLNTRVILCGAMFGLKVYRHRWFETSFLCFQLQHTPHHDHTPSAGRGLSPKGFISVTGTGGAMGLTVPYMKYVSEAMGIDWMDRAGISQAIPPAYTRHIGTQLRRVLDNRAAVLMDIVAVAA